MLCFIRESNADIRYFSLQQHTENKLKKKVASVEGDKVMLATRVEDLTLHVSDLEEAELIIKHKLKVGLLLDF